MIFSSCAYKVTNVKIEINSVIIDRVNCCSFLGVELDDQLNWRRHITKVENKIINVIGILYKVRKNSTAKLRC